MSYIYEEYLFLLNIWCCIAFYILCSPDFTQVHSCIYLPIHIHTYSTEYASKQYNCGTDTRTVKLQAHSTAYHHPYLLVCLQCTS
jgi:hypothetical protein